MPKPISTALHVNDPFSGGNVNPPYGDKASQGQVTMKSDSTSASAARPSRPAAVDAADHTERVTSSSPGTIYVYVNASGFSYPPGSNVAAGGTVWLQSNTGATAYVSTSQGGTAVNVFTTGSSPYSCPVGGERYTLKSTISGSITLDVSGTTGTINVGGGSAPPSPLRRRRPSPPPAVLTEIGTFAHGGGAEPARSAGAAAGPGA